MIGRRYIKIDNIIFIILSDNKSIIKYFANHRPKELIFLVCQLAGRDAIYPQTEAGLAVLYFLNLG